MFIPDLSRSRNNPPCRKPEYPVGSVLPEASKINPSSSYLSTTLYLYGVSADKNAASFELSKVVSIASTRSNSNRVVNGRFSFNSNVDIVF